MGTFKFRESVDAPWQELPIIGSIYTQDVRPEGGGFSTDTHNVIIINNPAQSNYYTWQDWENYITNLDNVEFLFIQQTSASYMYIKGILADRDADNRFPVVFNNYASGKSTISDRSGTSYIQFTEGTGVRISYTGSSFVTPTASSTAIYCVVKKEAV